MKSNGTTKAAAILKAANRAVAKRPAPQKRGRTSNAERAMRAEAARALANAPAQAPAPAHAAVTVGSAILTITPAMAETFLSGKLPNRTLRNGNIDRFERDMREGAWHLNGEAMIFSGAERDVRAGRIDAGLLDGQHRCWAVVASDRAITTNVVWGVPPESMASIDTGKSRQFQDVLSIRGTTNAATVGGAARWWYWYEKLLRGEVVQGGAGSTEPTHAELTDVTGRYPTLEAAASLVQRHGKAKRLLSPSVLAWLVSYHLEHGNGERVEQFIDALETGTDDGWGTTHPVYHLFTRMTANRLSDKKLTPLVTAAYGMKAMNAYMKGRALKMLKWQRHDEKPEEFPRFE